MWKKTFIQSVGLVCVLGFASCDQVESIVADVSGDSAPKERRAGIKKVHNANPSDVREWLAEPNVLVVLSFYSSTCPPCKVMNPHLDMLAEKYADKSAIMKLNVGKPGEVATMAMNEYKINETPVLKFYLNGEEVKEMRGIQTEEDLDLAFKKYTSRIKGEFVMREGDLPGMKVARTPEEMMVPVKKGELPEGFTRAKVPKDVNDVTAGLPEGVLNAGPPPQPTIPAGKAQ